jgi:hypothetical protein
MAFCLARSGWLHSEGFYSAGRVRARSAPEKSLKTLYQSRSSARQGSLAVQGA